MNGLLALAFTAGMLAPVNPCGFALLPAWITHTLGDTATEPLGVRTARALRTGVAFTLGFAGTLAVAGLAISAGARALISAAPWLGLVVGVALVLLGVVMFTGRVLGLRLPTRALRPATGPGGTTGIVLAGIGYAAASLSCTVGVLLAVIAQAQATAGWGALLAVFVAYTLGAATILLLVSLAAAAAGTALTHHLAALARHGTRITATVLILTGAYLAWYWLPAVTGDTTGTNGFAALSTTASTWLQNHTPLMATIAALTVLTAAVTVLAHRMIRRRVTDAAPVDCCTPTTVIEEGRPQ